VYAMGGKPLMAIAILGWPVNILAPEVAQKVLDGARAICAEAGIPLAGGHSIDAPEPIFGLAVTGLINNAHIKRNNTAGVGDLLYLTKPLGIGILTTAEKQGKLLPEHAHIAPDVMKTLNVIGQNFAALDCVTAMTDVTGFALLGHLLEICQGSEVAAVIDFNKVPCLDFVHDYIDQGCIPGGCDRNFISYGDDVGPLNDKQKTLLCDPQTSGGLLVAVKPDGREAFETLCQDNGLNLQPIGELVTEISPVVSLL
ncbi:MAG: selenide, water dikinase SelD, partial [Alteromonadaceae bacterium]